MKKALVIGGCGLLGRGISPVLLQSGWSVTLLGRGQVKPSGELKQCEFLQVDRKDREACARVLAGHQWELVVDCAAYTLEDTRQAVELFQGRVKHYWFISTDFVYAVTGVSRYPLTEETSGENDQPYGLHKREAEKFLIQSAESGKFPVTILRPPHILGEGRPAGCDPAAGGRDPELVKRIKSGESIPLLLGGQFLIQPVWSREIGNCICALMGNPDTFGKIFNAPGGECVTVRQYYLLLAEICGVPLKVTPVDPEIFKLENPQQAHSVRHRIYDTQKLRAAGFAPTLSLNAALAETLQPFL